MLTIMLILCSCAQDIASPAADEPVVQVQDSPAVVPGEVIVKFTDDMTELLEADLASGSVRTRSGELNLLADELGIASMERVFSHGGEFEERMRAAGLHRWYRVKYDTATPLTKASEGFAGLPGVEEVEEVRKVKNTAYFNDPRLKDQWHYKNDGTTSGHKAGADINVEPVWENYTTGSRNVIVAVVDGGIDAAHEDLAANYINGKSFVDKQSKVVPHDHGTHVAGTIAAVNNNGKGVSGIAGGDAKAGIQGVGLLSCQIFAPNPENPEKDLGGNGADAIVWGANNGAVISQNSWGYVYETAEEQAAAKIPSHLAAAIDYFIENAGLDASGKQVGPMKGGIVIFAAGNDGRPDDPIGKYEPVLSVGSIGPNLTRAGYSNYGDWVDIAAPGGDAPTQILSTVPDNKYGYMQGTSMACPHVSGVAALVVSQFGGPGFTPETLRNKLIKGANSSVLSKNAKIGPLVDAFGAMTYGGTKPPVAVNAIEAKPQSNNINMTWNVTTDPDDKKAYGFLLVAAKDKSLLSSMDPGSVPQGVASAVVMTETLKAGEQISGSITDLEFNQKYSVAVFAFDYNRNWSPISPIKEVQTEANNAPVVTTAYTGDFRVKSHETLKVIYTITDPDAHTMDVKFTAGSAAAAFVQIPDGTWQLTLVGNAADPDKYQAVMTVTDKYGAVTEKTIAYELLENHAPVIVKDIEDMIFTAAGGKFSLEMDEYLEDPDGEQLIFDISISDNKVLHLNPKNNVLHATVLAFGKTDVSIKATDSRGETCVLTFKVVVKDPSKPLELYPNPVADYLNVSTLDLAKTTIRIVSTTGKVVYDETSDVSAAEPAKVDMTTCPPGAYSVFVSFSGKEYKQTIVKL